MKSIRLPLLLLAMLAASQGFAATQQEKMKSCNAEATAQELKGDVRKTFMSNCLKATQQEKMISCNKTASEKALKGDERKAFLSECLKKK
ncbi:PsiF family protein [Pseudomonas sp. USHLN015]|uniref:PsiF family protein n=1 Tax=Pseudomonas sp. USHLN015 TaxID=3081296 RepID=UPI00301E39F0